MKWHTGLLSCAFVVALAVPAEAHHSRHATEVHQSSERHTPWRSLSRHAIAFIKPAPVNPNVQQVPKPAFRALDHIPVATIIPAIRREHRAQHDQVLCLALAMYHEQREINEETDRLAVAQVIYNRVTEKELSVCATIWAMRGSQFQWVKHGNITPHELAVWALIQADAVAFVKHRPTDITHGATHFYNPLLCKPTWATFGVVTARFKHVFIRMRPAS